MGHHQYKFLWEDHKLEADSDRLRPGDQPLKQKNAKKLELLLVPLSTTQMTMFNNTPRS